MRSLIIICFLIFGMNVNAHSQNIITRKTASKKSLAMYKRGLQYVKGNKFDKALKDFNKALKLQPTFIDAMIQKAAIFYMRENYAVAEQGFEKILDLDKNYNSKVYYTLAISERRQKKYDEAIGHFKDYVATKKHSEKLAAKAKIQIKNLVFIQKAVKNPVPFDPKPISPLINTTNAEYLPCITADNSQLIYTKRIGGQEDLYVSEKINGDWGMGLPIDDINNPISNEGGQSISADGKFLVFVRCETKASYGSCDLFYSELKKGRWTRPRNMGENVNSTSWDSQPSVSANGNILYFTSNRPGGRGGRDLWVSYRKKNGGWIKAINLGAPINTKGNEQSPFIHPDDQTLYFMSNALPGMGGDDLYFSKKTGKKWGAPKNLGYPINTEGNEGALVISLDGKTGYFTSDRKYDPNDGVSSFQDAPRGKETDIYYFAIDPSIRPEPVNYLRAIVTDITDGKRLQADVEFSNLTTNKIFLYSKTDSKGEFLVCLPSGKNYGLNCNKKGYLFYSDNFNLIATTNVDEPYVLEIKLTPIGLEKTQKVDQPMEKAKPIVLKNVFFDTGSAELLPTSFVELDHLVDLLNEHIALKIQLNGHTDNVGSDADNMKLSSDRAQSVKEYLIKKGILPVRLVSKGFGETVPVDTNDTDAGRANNRRTEFMIL